VRGRLRIRQWVEFRSDKPPVRRGDRGVVVDVQPEEEVYTVRVARRHPLIVAAYREDLRPLTP
jgi:hypothetical protein